MTVGNALLTVGDTLFGEDVNIFDSRDCMTYVEYRRENKNSNEKDIAKRDGIKISFQVNHKLTFVYMVDRALACHRELVGVFLL